MSPSAGLPLTGRHIVVTRPAAQAGRLRASLEAAGARVVECPLLEIVAEGDAAHFAPYAARLDDYARVFFVSANAVVHGLAGLRAHRPWPPGPPVATVGPGSARALADAGFDAVCAPPSVFDSEGVLALPEFAADAVCGRRILIVRGSGGRDLLGDALRERGAEVDYLACYRRVPAVPDLTGLLAAHARQALDAILLTSSEGLAPFVAALKHQQGGELLSTLTAFAPHARIADNARQAGFARVILTAGSDAGLVAGLRAYYGVSP